MVDVRFLKTAAGQFPALPNHLATVTYVDTHSDTVVAPALSATSDQVMYGDVYATCARRDAQDAAGMDNGFYTITGVVAPKTFTATKIRFGVVTAGTVTGTPAVALGFYGGTGPSQPQLATAPITGAMLTTTGVKELTLSTPVSVFVGNRYLALFYIPPSAFSARPSFASIANARSVLMNPPGAFFCGYKAASTAPPATVDTSDGSYTGGTTVTTVLWWALL